MADNAKSADSAKSKSKGGQSSETVSQFGAFPEVSDSELQSAEAPGADPPHESESDIEGEKTELHTYLYYEGKIGHKKIPQVRTVDAAEIDEEAKSGREPDKQKQPSETDDKGEPTIGKTPSKQQPKIRADDKEDQSLEFDPKAAQNHRVSFLDEESEPELTPDDSGDYDILMSQPHHDRILKETPNVRVGTAVNVGVGREMKRIGKPVYRSKRADDSSQAAGPSSTKEESKGPAAKEEKSSPESCPVNQEKPSDVKDKKDEPAPGKQKPAKEPTKSPPEKPAEAKQPDETKIPTPKSPPAKDPEKSDAKPAEPSRKQESPPSKTDQPSKSQSMPAQNSTAADQGPPKDTHNQPGKKQDYTSTPLPSGQDGLGEHRLGQPRRSLFAKDVPEPSPAPEGIFPATYVKPAKAISSADAVEAMPIGQELKSSPVLPPLKEAQPVSKERPNDKDDQSTEFDPKAAQTQRVSFSNEEAEPELTPDDSGDYDILMSQPHSDRIMKETPKVRVSTASNVGVGREMKRIGKPVYRSKRTDESSQAAESSGTKEEAKGSSTKEEKPKVPLAPKEQPKESPRPVQEAQPTAPLAEPSPPIHYRRKVKQRSLISVAPAAKEFESTTEAAIVTLSASLVQPKHQDSAPTWQGQCGDNVTVKSLEFKTIERSDQFIIDQVAASVQEMKLSDGLCMVPMAIEKTMATAMGPVIHEAVLEKPVQRTSVQIATSATRNESKLPVPTKREKTAIQQAKLVDRSMEVSDKLVAMASVEPSRRYCPPQKIIDCLATKTQQVKTSSRTVELFEAESSVARAVTPSVKGELSTSEAIKHELATVQRPREELDRSQEVSVGTAVLVSMESSRRETASPEAIKNENVIVQRPKEEADRSQEVAVGAVAIVTVEPSRRTSPEERIIDRVPAVVNRVKQAVCEAITPTTVEKEIADPAPITPVHIFDAHRARDLERPKSALPRPVRAASVDKSFRDSPTHQRVNRSVAPLQEPASSESPTRHTISVSKPAPLAVIFRDPPVQQSVSRSVAGVQEPVYSEAPNQQPISVSKAALVDKLFRDSPAQQRVNRSVAPLQEPTSSETPTPHPISTSKATSLTKVFRDSPGHQYVSRSVVAVREPISSESPSQQPISSSKTAIVDKLFRDSPSQQRVDRSVAPVQGPVSSEAPTQQPISVSKAPSVIPRSGILFYSNASTTPETPVHHVLAELVEPTVKDETMDPVDIVSHRVIIQELREVDVKKEEAIKKEQATLVGASYRATADSQTIENEVATSMAVKESTFKNASPIAVEKVTAVVAEIIPTIGGVSKQPAKAPKSVQPEPVDRQKEAVKEIRRPSETPKETVKEIGRLEEPAEPEEMEFPDEELAPIPVERPPVQSDRSAAPVEKPTPESKATVYQAKPEPETVEEAPTMEEAVLKTLSKAREESTTDLAKTKEPVLENAKAGLGSEMEGPELIVDIYAHFDVTVDTRDEQETIIRGKVSGNVNVATKDDVAEGTKADDQPMINRANEAVVGQPLPFDFGGKRSASSAQFGFPSQEKPGSILSSRYDDQASPTPVMTEDGKSGPSTSHGEPSAAEFNARPSSNGIPGTEEEVSPVEEDIRSTRSRSQTPARRYQSGGKLKWAPRSRSEMAPRGSKSRPFPPAGIDGWTHMFPGADVNEFIRKMMKPSPGTPIQLVETTRSKPKVVFVDSSGHVTEKK